MSRDASACAAVCCCFAACAAVTAAVEGAGAWPDRGDAGAVALLPEAATALAAPM